MPVPLNLLLLPLLFVALLFLLLTMIARRRREERGETPAPTGRSERSERSERPERPRRERRERLERPARPARPARASRSADSGLSAAEEVRLLRMQVETLTEALAEARAQARAATGAAEPAGATAMPEPVMTEAVMPEAVVPVEPVEPVAEVEVPDRPAVAIPVVDAAIEPVVLEQPTEVPVELPAMPDLIDPAGLGDLPHPEPHAEPQPAPMVETMPVFSPMVEVEPLVCAPTPEPTNRGDVDHTAHAYAALSRSLAGAGRLREAALAQWAADLRVLAPLIGDRGAELCEALADLAPTDPAAAISGARAVASSLVDPRLGPDVAVIAMLADTAHLSGDVPAAVRRPYPNADVSADVLPDSVVVALESALVASAAESGDTGSVSIGLRCDLVTHVVAELLADPGAGHRTSGGSGAVTADEAVAVVRDVLEPHERRQFDLALTGGPA